jgi:hypothetical protein
MNKEFVPYEQSLALKELGFDEPCIGRYYYKESYPMLNPNSGETELVFEFGQYIKQTEITILAPLYQQAFRWFREKYSWQHSMEPTADQHRFEVGYNYWIWNSKTGEEYHTMPKNRPTGDWEYETYEESELECLKKLIEIVKNK